MTGGMANGIRWCYMSLCVAYILCVVYVYAYAPICVCAGRCTLMAPVAMGRVQANCFLSQAFVTRQPTQHTHVMRLVYCILMLTYLFFLRRSEVVVRRSTVDEYIEGICDGVSAATCDAHIDVLHVHIKDTIGEGHVGRETPSKLN